MNVGIFSDTYDPSMNGIVYVVKSLKKELEKLGHKVYIFCPSERLLTKDKNKLNDFKKNNIYKIPSVKGILFDDFRLTVFNPKKWLKKVEKLNLDIIHFVTPGQMAFFAMYCSKKLNISIIAQHTTDIFEYFKFYKRKAILLPYLSGILVPFVATLSDNMKKDIRKSFKPKLKNPRKISNELIGKLLGIIYDNCDFCICVSDKSLDQLKGFSYGNSNFEVIPTGVNRLETFKKDKVIGFRKKYNIDQKDKVIMYCGRISKEKNLEFLISVIEHINQKYKNVKLMFVGDFEYREKLESIALKSTSNNNIIFTGRIKHKKLGLSYQSSDLFVFPSITDTQGLVLTEAASLGLPIVLIDEKVTKVVKNGKNGYISDGNVPDFSKKVTSILFDKKKYNLFSKNSEIIASKFTDEIQTKKIVKIYKNALKKT